MPEPKPMRKLMPDSLLPVGRRVGAADRHRRAATESPPPSTNLRKLCAYIKLLTSHKTVLFLALVASCTAVVEVQQHQQHQQSPAG